jgi:general secretion pathway protein L
MKLRVWLPPMTEMRGDSNVEFEVIGPDGRVQHRDESNIAALPKGMNSELVLHGRDGVMLDVRLPRLSGSRLAAALPGLVEERIASDAEDVHVVSFGIDADGVAAVAVVDRSLLARTLELFRRSGLAVVSATVNPMALPWKPGSWRVRIRDGFGSVRTGARSGLAFASDADTPVELRLLIGQTTSAPETVEVDGDCDVRVWSEALGVEVRQILPDELAPELALDLMQYQFAPGVGDWKQLRTPVVLGVMLFVVALGGLNLHAWKLRGEEQVLRARMSAIVVDAIPGVPVILDPLLQMQRRVAALRSGVGLDTTGFLAKARSLSEIVRADTVDVLEFRDGVLNVQFAAQVADTQVKRDALIASGAQAGLVLRFSGNSATVRSKTGG